MPTIDLTEFVVLERIPVLETGVEYPASTGPFTVNSTMITEALRAQDDPHIVPPRIKIAHADNPINADLQNLFDEVNQERDASQPAFGTIINMYADNGGHTLVGDWYGLPAWLAAILETAYPARSIEGGSWRNTANNKEYLFMLEAVSLLGVVGPGCTSLDDLKTYFSAEGPNVTVIEMARPKTTTNMEGKKPMPVVAQVNVEDIRRAFYSDFAQGDRYWWWDRELLADPWEFIVSDPDAGQLYRVPFVAEEDANGDTIVSSWGEPEPVKIQYVEDPGGTPAVQASRLIGPQLEKAGRVIALNIKPLRSKPKPNKEAKAAMAIDISALRTRLGLSEEDLPDDATEEQINAALAAPEPEETEEKPEETAETTVPAVAASASGGGPKGVVVDADVWAETQRGAQLAIQQARDSREAADRALLEKRVREGAILPASRDAYMAKLAGPAKDHNGPDRDQIRSFIEGLEAGVLPVQEVGHSEGDNPAMESRQGTGLFPRLEQRRRERQEA